MFTAALFTIAKIWKQSKGVCVWTHTHTHTHTHTQEYYSAFKKNEMLEHLPGSVSTASNFGSGHDLIVHEFEPRVRLCVDRSEPGAGFGFSISLSLSLSLSLPVPHYLSLFQE